MAVRTSTSALVRLNAKLEAMHLARLGSPPDGTSIPEGRFITRDSNGNAALATAAKPLVYLCWNPDDRSDVQDKLVDKIGGGANPIYVDTGGITGIIGNGGFEIGLPVANVAGAAGDSTDVNKMIISGATGIPTVAALPAINYGAAGTGTVDIFIFGIVSRVENGVVFFIFNSVAQMLKASS